MTGTDRRSAVIASADWLQARLGEPGLSIVDASWYLPVQNRDARGEYDAGHIPGAVFFDQDVVVEPGVDLPHAMPSPAVFARHAGAMGISADDTIVVYDGPGLFSAPRVWWLFKVMGARDVRLLDGGLDNWQAEDRLVTADETTPAPCLFETRYDSAVAVSLADMQGFIDASGAPQIVDARPAGRFTGADPEPRAGMRSGHMPGARNVPALQLAQDGRLLDDAALQALFSQAGVDVTRPVVTTCGSGVTAATLVLALDVLGHPGARLYDGSWSEWGSRSDTPVATGEA